MKVTEASVVLNTQLNEQREGFQRELLAHMVLVLDDQLVIHGVKVIRGRRGIFISLPNEKKSDRCLYCMKKNSVTAAYCNYCGGELDSLRWQDLPPNKQGYISLYNDLIHPIDATFRSYLHEECLKAYELEKHKQDHTKLEVEVV